MMKKPNNAFFVRTISWATVALACASLGQRALASSDLYAVGVAKVDITPSYPVRLNGFGVRLPVAAPRAAQRPPNIVLFITGRGNGSERNALARNPSLETDGVWPRLIARAGSALPA